MGRFAACDRLEAHNDVEINRKAEEEPRAVLDDLNGQDEALAKIVEAWLVKTNGQASASQARPGACVSHFSIVAFASLGISIVPPIPAHPRHGRR